MVRLSRVWRAVWRMGHPLVRWSVLLMTQHGGMPAQWQGDGEGIEALPLNWVECGKSGRTKMRDKTLSSRRNEAAKKMPSHFRAQEKRGGAVSCKDRHGYRRLE